MNEQQVDRFGTLVSISCLVQFPPRLPFCQQTIVSDGLPEAEADLICIEHIVQIPSLQPMPHPHVLLFNTGKVDWTGVTMALILLQYVAPLESINPTVAELDGIAWKTQHKPQSLCLCNNGWFSDQLQQCLTAVNPQGHLLQAWGTWLLWCNKSWNTLHR